MIYLSGKWRPEYAALGLGLMVTPETGYRVPPGVPWAADNGCFAGGPTFRLGRYLAWLARQRAQLGACLFAVAPDVYGDAAATWARSAPVLPQLRALGYPAALVAQPGLRLDAVEWATFDVLFIGGPDPWKLTPRGLTAAAGAAIAAARARGKWVHAGRVNGGGRLRLFAAAGAQSADGTVLARDPGRARKVAAWARGASAQLSLWSA